MHRNRAARPSRLRRWIVAAVGVLALANLAPAHATTRQQLQEARSRLAKIAKELRAARAKKQQIHREIQGLIRQTQQALSQKDALEEHIQAARADVRTSSDRIEELQGRLDERARQAYIDGLGGVLEVVLEAESLADLSDRVAYVDVLSRSDASLAAGLDTERRQLLRFEGDLVDLHLQQVELLGILKKQKKQLDAKFAAQVEVERGIKKKVAQAEAVVSDLERRYRDELLAAIAASAGTPPPDVDGKPGPFYHCPVDAPRSYINDFGYPRVGHTHQGNDVFAPMGTPIRAPFDGIAEEGSNGLGGLSVHVYATNGTGDYVYNAHLSRYAGVSGAVKAGDLVGYVGDTGNARGTPPHDHFEYHPGGGSAITPYFYLNEICGVGGAGL